MNGTEKNYKFGQKNNWRRRVWNEVARRVPNIKNAVVLYLAGPQDLDRKVALEHGFRPDNLIIVERDKHVVENLRKEGKIVIHGDLLQVIHGWQFSGTPISVVNADLCSGLSPWLDTLYDTLCYNPVFKETVVAMNLLRGRDQESEDDREIAREVLMLDEDERKHRGVCFLAVSALRFMNIALYGDASYEQVFKDHVLIRAPRNEEELEAYLKLLALHNPVAYSYNSGKLVFDSLVFSSPMRVLKTAVVTPPVIVKSEVVSNMRRQIAAALAVRTMRMNGTLSHSVEE